MLEARNRRGNPRAANFADRRTIATFTDMSSNLFNLTGRKALVTGGGRGLGRAIAVGLAQFGADVAVTSRTVTELEETAAAVRAAGRECFVIPGDASSKVEIDRVVHTVADHFGRIDILINNAGVDAAHPALDYPEHDFDFVLDVNLKAYFYFAQAVAKVMIPHGGGTIVCNSSICGEVAVKNISAYNISKGGVNMLTKSLALEWAEYGIRVNAFSPAYMEAFMPGAASEHDERKEQAIRELTPLARRGKPEELVGPVVFLASDASSYVTGEVLMVDGGWTIR
jgi:NAD(P)-dependent dehydrogenase (short-subunit alcohol dehydrogenase family)